MRPIKTMSKQDLLMASVDLMSKTYIELGLDNVEEETIMVMSQNLSKDLAKIYKNFYFEDAEEAFSLGVRNLTKTDFIRLNVPLYWNWLRKYREIIWDARARVDKGEDPKQVPYFRPEPKLLT